MKKISLISGLLIVTMLIMYFTGIIDFNNSIKKSIIEGNQLYTSKNYDKALQIYKEGLVKDPEDLILNYNAGQAAYLLGDYQQAITNYNKTTDKIDKYLNLGNSNFKMQQYQQALETYKEGILKFPQNIELKYNYEFVKNKIEEQNKSNEDQKDQENKDQENKDQKDNNQDQQDQKDNNQDQEDNKQDQKNKENQDNKEDKENQQDENSQENQEENKDNSSGEENDSSESEQNDKEIMQVLEMLEKQEEDSLKNNHEVKNQGKEEKYDW